MNDRKKILGMYPKELVYLCAMLAFGVGVLLVVVHLPYFAIIPFAAGIGLFAWSIRIRRREFRDGE